jgi:hypothetical protein
MMANKMTINQVGDMLDNTAERQRAVFGYYLDEDHNPVWRGEAVDNYTSESYAAEQRFTTETDA